MYQLMSSIMILALNIKFITVTVANIITYNGDKGMNWLLYNIIDFYYNISYVQG